MNEYSRRAYLGTLATVAVAGCTSSGDTESEGAEASACTDHSPRDARDEFVLTDGDARGRPPLAEQTLPVPGDPASLQNAIVSGGVPKDGIPSIDDPHFVDADSGDELLGEKEPVFGITVNGFSRAYPQRILVWHEIVNDEIEGENVAVTYCPLTGTAQGFLRGRTEFGVSGLLLNSNLVMYDRETDSLWPQMLATGIDGQNTGNTLREFQVIWTNWDCWRTTFPGTSVLSDDTGFARNYGSDPYGSYTPLSGFYTNDTLLFEPYSPVDDSELHLKDVVIGARSSDGSVAVREESLAEAGLLETTVGDVPHVAVYDPELRTGHIYRNSTEKRIEYDDETGTAVVDGNSYEPDTLPLEQLVRYDAFWFAWAGYYPNTEVLG